MENSIQQIKDDSLVIEIHKAFKEALTEEIISLKSNDYCNSSLHQDNREVFLQRAGFRNFSNRKPDVDLAKVEKLRKLNELRSKWQEAAPLYNYITLEELENICEKYNLVYGSPDCYTEEIPTKNQDDIYNFKLLNQVEGCEIVSEDGMPKFHIVFPLKDYDNCFYKRDKRSDNDRWYSCPSNAFGMEIHYECFYMADDGSIPDISWGGSLSGYYMRYNVQHKIKDDRIRRIGNIKIKDIDKEFSNLSDAVEYCRKNEVVPTPSKDPVVLAETTDGGFLIVTAWGTEASYAEFQNPINN